ncbi:MAG: bis-aminopropyl spermidine synthase family protein [Candidatus Heimdallarchaeota archaeon]
MKNDSSKVKRGAEELLTEIALKAQVAEGKESIRRVLREIFRKGTIGTKSLAKRLFLPVPTIAAIRNELEKEELITRTEQGAVLTEKGLKFVTKDLQFRFIEDLRCKRCFGRTIGSPGNFDELITQMKDFGSRRPRPLTEFDQAFARPITALNRAFLMLENDDLEGRSVLLLGDDDFTSLAIGLLQLNIKVTVIDIDQRLLDLISNIASERNFQIECLKHDLREPLPASLHSKFDTILLDPPYTPNGLTLFLSRAVQALKQEPNRRIYLSFVHRPPNEMLLLQKTILEMGLVFSQLLPGFNIYEGSEMHGNTTAMIVLTTTSETRPSITTSLRKEIYTGEVNPTIRTYRCANGHTILVGKSTTIHTIEELKEKGCPICGSKERFLRIKRETK